jgi:hypothetical protein
MGLFSKLLKKTPENVTAHILDPNSGYQTESWTVGSDVSDDTVSRLADGTNIYVVHVYEAGEMKQIICKREIWLSTKAQMDAIDNAGQAAMARTKEKLDKLR